MAKFIAHVAGQIRRVPVRRLGQTRRFRIAALESTDTHLFVTALAPCQRRVAERRTNEKTGSGGNRSNVIHLCAAGSAKKRATPKSGSDQGPFVTARIMLQNGIDGLSAPFDSFKL